ncbi:MAG: rhodanese-like domain-containing protein [Myxococcota bacterium]|nr:rhodanese-like domain-containing protein [Myxococcota bacterium]
MGIRSRLKGTLKSLLGRDAAPAAPARPAPTPPVPPQDQDNAASLANIECDAQELYERLEAGESIVIVDVRTDGEVAGGMLPSAHHIPLQQLEARWRELEDADEIVCYCAVGARSLRAAELLRTKGLINATSLEGGLPAWKAAGGKLA